MNKTEYLKKENEQLKKDILILQRVLRKQERDFRIFAIFILMVSVIRLILFLI